jgi:hypothetical protein
MTGPGRIRHCVRGTRHRRHGGAEQQCSQNCHKGESDAHGAEEPQSYPVGFDLDQVSPHARLAFSEILRRKQNIPHCKINIALIRERSLIYVNDLSSESDLTKMLGR